MLARNLLKARQGPTFRRTEDGQSLVDLGRQIIRMSPLYFRASFYTNALERDTLWFSIQEITTKTPVVSLEQINLAEFDGASAEDLMANVAGALAEQVPALDPETGVVAEDWLERVRAFLDDAI